MVRIEIAKRVDGSGLLRCTRSDGSVSWQKQESHGVHFALHDLTHFAVETVLGYRGGFFGLIESGWEIEDTTGKGARGTLPPEALMVEKIVGLFDSERASGARWTVDEFNAYAPRTLTADEIEEVRSLRGDLFRRWKETQAGEKLRLDFGKPDAQQR